MWRTVTLSAVLIIKVECLLLPFFLSTKQFCTEDNGLESGGCCANFYQRVCYDWTKSNEKPDWEPFWNQYTAANDRILQKLHRLLQAGGPEMHQPKILYKTCLESLGENITPLRNVFDKMGGWYSKNLKNYKYVEHVAAVSRYLDVHPIFKLHIDIDLFDSKKAALYVFPGTFVYPELYLLSPQTHKSEILMYKKWVSQSIKHLYPEEWTPNVVDVVHFEIKLAQISTSVKGPNEKIGIQDVSILLGTNLQNVLKILFNRTNVDYKSIESVIVNVHFLKMLRMLMESSDSRTISNYIVWSCVKALSGDSSVFLKKLSLQIDKELLGVNADIPRPKECLQSVLQFYSHEFVQPYVKGFLKSETLSLVLKMSENLKRIALKIIKTNPLYSGQFKKWAFQKVSQVSFEVGFPNNTTASSISQIRLDDNYLNNKLKLITFNVRQQLEQSFQQPNSIKWPGYIFDVNAYYNVLQNAIIIPLGILQPPFYDPRASSSRNLGALGSLIGHELAHSFNTFTTDIRNAQTPHDAIKYSEMTHCLDILDNSTLQEDVADIVGLKIAYAALETSSASSRTFFKSYSRMWCEIGNDKDLLLYEEHSPVELRVSRTLHSFGPFKKTYRCGYEQKDCNIW